MIVKITYSTYVEDVPMEVVKIVSSLQEEFEALSKDLTLISEELEKNDQDLRTPIVKFEHSIKHVEKLQAKIKDCKAILDGLENLRKNPPLPQDVPPPNPMK